MQNKHNDQSLRDLGVYVPPTPQTFEVEVFRIVTQKKRYKVTATCTEDAIEIANAMAKQDRFESETPFISDIIKENKDGNRD